MAGKFIIFNPATHSPKPDDVGSSQTMTAITGPIGLDSDEVVVHWDADHDMGALATSFAEARSWLVHFFEGINT